MALALLIAFVVMSTETSAQIATGKCKFLGNISGNSVPDDFITYWDQITPENAGKWGYVEATRGNMNWSALDAAYKFAKNNGIPFKQHTLVWGQQQPSWVSALPAHERREEVEEWIKAFCERYPDTDYIDVVNEPLHAVPDYMSALGGTGSTGYDWVVWAFEKAREYCPNAKLILNDYNILSDNSATANYISLINILKSRGLIDIIGEQGHFLETTPLNTIQQNLDKLAETGLPIHISEFDIHIADDAQQRDRYEELFPVFWRHKSVHGITLWGYRQGQIWRTDAYLLRSDNSERPAMTWLKQYVSNPATPGGTFCITSTETGAEIGFDAYPNPSGGRVVVELDGGRHALDVIDAKGRLKWTQVVEHESSVEIFIDEPGLYVLRISDGYGTRSKKILIR